MKGAIAKTSEGGAEEQKAAWDDVRRMSRLYDTGLRKARPLPSPHSLDVTVSHL